jgi:hypothetical protein
MEEENSEPVPEFPEWATLADQHMFGIPNKYPVPWNEFEEAIRTTRESTFMTLEQKRYEECSTGPGPDNDVIVSSVLIIWSESVISVQKNVSHGDWPQAYAGGQLTNLFKVIPEGSIVTVVTESSDLTLAFKHCCEQAARHVQPEGYTTMSQWIWMMRTSVQKGIQFPVRTFTEEEDMEWIKMRMLGRFY